MNHSTPGFTVHHQLPEFTHTHVHRVGDATHYGRKRRGTKEPLDENETGE